jgi:hypothetical protein
MSKGINERQSINLFNSGNGDAVNFLTSAWERRAYTLEDKSRRRGVARADDSVGFVHIQPTLPRYGHVCAGRGSIFK